MGRMVRKPGNHCMVAAQWGFRMGVVGWGVGGWVWVWREGSEGELEASVYQGWALCSCELLVMLMMITILSKFKLLFMILLM